MARLIFLKNSVVKNLIILLMQMDFLVQREGALLPIEVKGGTSIKATSLHNYLKEHPDISAIRYSMLPYRQQENISNIPLYGAFLRT